MCFISIDWFVEKIENTALVKNGKANKTTFALHPVDISIKVQNSWEHQTVHCTVYTHSILLEKK